LAVGLMEPQDGKGIGAMAPDDRFYVCRFRLPVRLDHD
jgi:hypothetical protein